MAHFLDTLVGQKFNPGLLFSDLIAELGHAECIIADNVYRYFYAQSGHYQTRIDENGDEEFLVSGGDLDAAHPAIVPPFEATFITAKGYVPHIGERGGILFVRRPILASQHQCFSDYLNSEGISTSRREMQSLGVRWIVYALPFVQKHNELIPPYMMTMIPVTEEGRWFKPSDERNAPLRYLHGFADNDAIERYEQMYPRATSGVGSAGDEPLPWREVFFAYERFWLFPALLTLSFVHCRNVEVIEHDPTPTRQLRRQSERKQAKTGYPLIRFRTVQIEPIKRVLHEEGRISEVGLAQALHICRGHFKDFREGPGLFGKHHEVYWWNDHRRGHLENGAILKDYRAPLDTS